MAENQIKKQAVVLVAHGSRRAESNQEVMTLAERIAPNFPDAEVSAAFLELAEPSIPEGLQAAIDAGHTQVCVIPYFLSRGRHVVEDVPNDVADVQQKNPTVEITVLPHLGASDALVDALIALVPSA